MSEIQFVTEPSVYVTAKLLPQFTEIERFLSDHQFSGERLSGANSVEVPITVGSRTCYQSFDSTGREHGSHVRHLIEVGHGSCLEHCVWQVMLSGISRACGRELLRHRHLSPSELSQRYCDLRYAKFVVHPADQEDYADWLKWDRGEGVAKGSRRYFDRDVALFRESIARYAARVGDGRVTKKERERARLRLPECVETRIVFTGNARAFRNLFERRCSDAADAEIRRVCCRLFEVLSADAPNVFADYERLDLHDGTFELKTPHRAV